MSKPDRTQVFSGTGETISPDATMARIGDDAQGSMSCWYKPAPVRWWRHPIQWFRLRRFWRAHKVRDDDIRIDLAGGAVDSGDEWTTVSLVQDGTPPVLVLADRRNPSWRNRLRRWAWRWLSS